MCGPSRGYPEVDGGQIRTPVAKGGQIGKLHDDIAFLTMKEGRIAANAKASIERPRRTRRLAKPSSHAINASVARPDYVSKEEIRRPSLRFTWPKRW